MKKRPIESLKKRILAAVLCASMLAGSFTVDSVVSYYNRDEVSADELEGDADIIQDEGQSGDELPMEDDQDINDDELSDAEDIEDDSTLSEDEEQAEDNNEQTDEDVLSTESDADMDLSDTEQTEKTDEEPSDEVSEEITLSAELDNLSVVISGTKEAFGTTVKIEVSEITDEKASDYESYFNNLDDGLFYRVPHVFDISLIDEEENETEPVSEVSVSLSGDAVYQAMQEDYELSVYHDELSGIYTNMDGALLSSMDDEDTDEYEEDYPSFYLEQMESVAVMDDSTISFTTGGFSDYALVLTGNNTQKEFDFDDGTYFEMDKYLEPTGEANGQTSYNIYLEHAFYDDSRIVVNNYAPARTDFMFCLDQSASVSGYTDDYNEAVKSLLHKIADTNAEREQNALNGEYDDIDPLFVAQSDANMRSAMKDHYMYVAGIVGYNNHLYERHKAANDPTLIRTEAEADAMAAKAYIKPDYSDYINGSTTTDQQDFTRTDLGTKWMYDLAQQGNWRYTYNTNNGTCNWNSLCCVLITDGDPYGEETTPIWPYPDSNFSGNAFSIYAANKALYWANKLKQEQGSMNFGIYVPFRNGNNASVLEAIKSGDINDLVIAPGTDIITLAFLSLWSSDIPNNGLFETVGSDNYHGDTTGAFYYYKSDKPRTFGKYIYADRSYPDLVNYVDSIVARINTEAWKSVNSRGYFGTDTIMQDEITDPFTTIGRDSISVYAVPRIPVNLDSDGIPTDMDEDTHEVSEFRWGELTVEDGEEMTSEWIDITDDVIVTLNGNRVNVTGYDFEWNAVTDYDKDIVRYPDGDSRGNGLVYKPGDYGYKVVVIVPIQAKFSFGGNGIVTNNSDVSGVIPSDPVGNNPNPPWIENEKLNPDGDQFVDMYPVPSVDLNVSYKIPKDNAIVYAPQTKELHDLLTDASMNSIWYTDEGYSSLKTIRDNAKWDLEEKEQIYYDLLASADDPMQIVRAQQDVIEATDALYAAQKDLDSVLCYIPDGRNNAFVDIFYTFNDPDGERIATLSVPHGQAYDMENPNIDWEMRTDGMVLNENGNPIITKSGVYTISATVTPVDTVRADDWQVSTQLDDDVWQQMYPNSSLDYSSTGSSADGSQSEFMTEENPEAYLFTLEVTTEDTRREPGQSIDFFEGPGFLRDMIDRKTNKHITGFQWVCTDGVTESVPDNEPGVDKKVMTGGDVTLEITVPQGAYDDGLVESVESIVTVRAETGQYVPVNILASRMAGDLNKSVGADEQVRQRSMIMTDSDNVYGTVSSIAWTHKCDILTEHDCNDDEFADSHRYDDVEETGRLGKVQYLMHVYENPEPDIEKSTSTPVITAGSEIHWNVSVKNDDFDHNEHMLPSEFTLVDVLPWLNDQRVDPDYGADRQDGSQFGGDLYFTKMSIDHSNMAAGKDGLLVYYTNDTAVRNASEKQLTGKENGITWIQAESYEVSGTETGFNIPNTATAVRVDTKLAWEEGLNMAMSANMKDPADQETGDFYCNEAWLMQDKGTIIDSNVVTTEVVSLHIAGTVWEDSDIDGLKVMDEPTIAGVKITLYQQYNPKNPNRVVRTINGLQLSEVFDLDNNKFVPVNTTAQGTYLFDNIPSGTYYVVADLIPEQYNITKKKAGEGKGNDAMIDSEAEEQFIASGEELEKTAWIKEIVVTDKSADNQNIGLTCIKGNIDVGKVVDQILYPSAMTEEERQDYRINATFVLRNTDTGLEYRRTVYLKEDTIHLKNTRPQVWAHFNDLPLGTYELTEVFDPNYHLAGVKYTQGDVTFSKGTGVVTVNVTADSPDVQLWMENVARPDPPAGDENGVTNFVNIRTPIKLEVIYSGPDPITDHSIYEYSFTASDFDHSKQAVDGSGRYGDIIVTYDDGSQIKLSDGTLSFDALTFNPAKVDSSMNSKNRRTSISVFYVERGHMVRDSFNVRVDLKPFFRFNVKFFANGSSFDTGAGNNIVDFMYNDVLGYNEVTTGIYKDTKNSGLNVLNGFWQAGWNTSPDGQGTQYGDADDALTPLCQIGRDKKLSTLELYANWKTNVTFHGNGGTVNGAASQTLTFSKGQSIATTWVGTKANHKFVLWNTKPDGTGEELSDYNRNHGGCQGPVTFYAIYYQSDYAYTGSVQTFTAPVSGIYEFELWGSPGGAGNSKFKENGERIKIPGGKGGYTKFYMYIDTTTRLYCFVGGSGNAGEGKETVGGWNGGGCVIKCGLGLHAGSGGGMTHVSYTNNPASDSDNKPLSVWNPEGTIGVAGGGGGSGYSHHKAEDKAFGGYGGGETAGNGVYSHKLTYVQKHEPLGATQTTGYKQGIGESNHNSGGGGGGWYGGYSTGHIKSTQGGACWAGGGGGSGYICEAGKQTKYTHLNKCLGGNSLDIPIMPTAATPINGDNGGYIRITLYERD